MYLQHGGGVAQDFKVVSNVAVWIQQISIQEACRSYDRSLFLVVNILTGEYNNGNEGYSEQNAESRGTVP